MSDAFGSRAALESLIVLEIGDGVAVAVCGRWLAAFGAHVVKIEPPEGDWTHRYSVLGDPTRSDSGALYRTLNPGKKSVTLDFTVPADRTLLRSLLLQADIVIHSLQPVELAALEIDFPSLRRLRERLVSVAVLPFGGDGPYADFEAATNVLLALGGYQFLSGEPGREPLAIPGFQPQYVTSLYGVTATLAALHDVAGGRAGVDIEISSLESLASLHQMTITRYLYQQRVRSRHGNKFEDIHPQVVLPCLDGYVEICLPNQEMWVRMCTLIERPDLVDDPRLATPQSRFQHAEVVDEALTEWLRDKKRDEFFHRTQEEWRLAVAPVKNVHEVIDDPQLAARDFWVVPRADDTVREPGMPVVMSESQWQLGRSPLLGEHTAEIRERASAGGIRPSNAAAKKHAAVAEGKAPLRLTGPQYPLAGLRVLDFTTVWAGPLCTRILADLGADVVRIERPMLIPSPGSGSPAPAPYFFGPANKHNRNKRSVGVDLGTVKGRELVKQLAAQSDVIVENFSARVMPNFGLGYPTLREINPGLIMISMSGFGASGPYKSYVSYGPPLEALSGLAWLLGYPGEAPVASAIAYPDATAGLTAAAAIVTALAHRDRTGAGQYIDFSQFEAVVAALGEYFVACQVAGGLPERLGNASSEWAPYGTFRCLGEDAWISLAVRDEDEWHRFCAATGLTALSCDPAYATRAQRRKHTRELNEAIGAWTLRRTKFEAMAELQRAGVPAGAVVNAKELLENPQLQQRGFYVDVPGSHGETYCMPGTPIHLNGATRDQWRQAPTLGEHNHAVLQEVLGLASHEVDALEEEGVLCALRATNAH